MNLTIRAINDPAAWNTFLVSLKPNTFLQSWEWGEVQKRDGETPHYVGFFHNNRQVGCALLVTIHAKRGSFLFCPHGPLFISDISPQSYLSDFLKYCRQLAAQEKVVALRISPLLITSEETLNLFKTHGFRPAPLHMHTELTWMLDTSQSAESVLANMRKTTRHSIKKAQAAGLKVDIVHDPGATVDRFWPLYEQTRTRHGFIPYSQKFLRTQVEVFNSANSAAGMYGVFVQHQNKDVAGAIIIHFANTAFYHHGASIKLPANLPASHLVQWSAIQEASRLGCTRYNFWGIAREDEPNHPFAGITIFKKGFGGYAIDYLHAQDLPLTFGYWKLWLVDTYRKLKRGF